MLKISPEQLEAFETFHLNKFRDEMLAHFAKHFPERTDHLDKAVFSKYIEDGIDEAQAYGLTTKKQICKFLNIKILMKTEVPFNQETHGWVVKILKDKELGKPVDRLNHLGDLVNADIERMEGGTNG